MATRYGRGGEHWTGCSFRFAPSAHIADPKLSHDPMSVVHLRTISVHDYPVGLHISQGANATVGPPLSSFTKPAVC